MCGQSTSGLRNALCKGGCVPAPLPCASSALSRERASRLEQATSCSSPTPEQEELTALREMVNYSVAQGMCPTGQEASLLYRITRQSSFAAASTTDASRELVIKVWT